MQLAGAVPSSDRAPDWGDQEVPQVRIEFNPEAQLGRSRDGSIAALPTKSSQARCRCTGASRSYHRNSGEPET